MLIKAFAMWPNEGQATLAIAGSNLTGVDNDASLTPEMHAVSSLCNAITQYWCWRGWKGEMTNYLEKRHGQ